MYKKSSGVRRYLQSVYESTDVTRAVLRQSIEAYRHAQSLSGEAALRKFDRSDQLLGVALDTRDIEGRLPFAEQALAAKEALRAIRAANAEAFSAALKLSGLVPRDLLARTSLTSGARLRG